VEKVRASPKLKHQNTCQQNYQQYFLIETNIKRLIAVSSKNKMTRNKIKKEKDSEIKCRK